MKNWWKVLAAVLLLYTVVMGLLGPAPRLPILNETIRNLYFHVPMWFGMTIILTASAVNSARYLYKPSYRLDVLAYESAQTGILMAVLGLATGSLWARFTWGTWWTSDPRLNGAAIAVLIYGAYLVLRSSITDEQQSARIGAVYNIFAYCAAIPLLFILPRLTDSLHPGAGGNPGFSKYDLDNNMRLVFYPAIIGWTLLGVWITQVAVRFTLVKHKLYEKQLA
ncbi:ABC transporter permease [Hymenobacter busanensis]|uniref:Heme exporter protein C n=1 Tax=Hymenobacter busanensis TaxID=2607656 RepID=A0A7L5A1X7_9BACT|nr:cytochrome c biogenesis protein CcsA [Hymenobacter busanensis]KAA9325277.1 ABC transporter permease [Hymenobacter busanensis]QHJ07730.1 ABC transporter permease [Hymenobacter busanensis]